MKLIIPAILSATLLSCDSSLCGELSGPPKVQYEAAKARATNLKIENIPCEFYYMKVTATTKNIDTTAIHAIHQYLYNQKARTGWPMLLVHDVDGKYVFSHNYNDSIYIQAGD